MASPNVRNWQEDITQFLFLLVAMVFSLFLNQGQLDGVVRDFFFRLQQPAWVVVQEVQQEVESLRQGAEIVRYGGKRLAELESQLSHVRVQEDRFAQLERENQLLRQELGRLQSTQTRVFRLYGNGRTWFIDGGTHHGVLIGQSVQREGALIGVVDEVFAHFSHVKTVLDTEWRVPVQVGTGSASPRGVYDQSRGVSQVEYVPLAQVVHAGDPVYTLGDAEVPPQLLLGWVESQEPAADEATWKLIVRPAFPLETLQWVELPVETFLPETSSAKAPSTDRGEQ